MEALKAEIASKRKAIEDDPILFDRPSKYVRRGDLEKLREERELKSCEAQTSLEDPSSKPTRVSTRSSLKLVYVLTRRWRAVTFYSSHFSIPRYRIFQSYRIFL